MNEKVPMAFAALGPAFSYYSSSLISFRRLCMQKNTYIKNSLHDKYLCSTLDR